MAMLKTALARALQARNYSAGAAGLMGPSAHGGENAGKMLVLWKRLSILGFGLVITCTVYNYLLHKEHEKHFVRPEFIRYPYLAKRRRKFPWGDGNHSLFHNPHTNALPTGYET